MLWDFKLFHRYGSSSLQEMKHVFRPNSRFLKFKARNESMNRNIENPTTESKFRISFFFSQNVYMVSCFQKSNL